MRIAAIILTLVSALLSILLTALTLAGLHLDIQATGDAAPTMPQTPVFVPFQVPAPSPIQPDNKKPRRPLLPWRAGDQAMEAGTPAMATIGSGLKSPDGTEEVIVDLPKHVRLKNTGGMGPRGPGSGDGLCVFTSINHMAFWQSVTCLQDLQQKMTHEPGGGYPQKVDQMLVRYCPDIKGHYVQNTDCTLEYIRDVLESGRLVGITYSGELDPHYHQHIEHMLNCIHLSEKWAAVLDNNFIADKDIVWMRPDALSYMNTSGHRRKGWAVVLLAPGPLPIPRN